MPKQPKPLKIGQGILAEWCTRWGAVVDIEMAADLVKRIEAAIIKDRAESASTL